MKNNSTTKVLLVAIALAALVIPAAAGAQAPAAQPLGPVTGNAVSGKTLYFDHGCYGCHGFNGETGRKFVGSPTPILANETNFITFLRARANQAPVLPVTSMPNYAEAALNDRQAKDIYAYIRSFKSNAPELKDIPTLNSIIESTKRPYRP